MSDVSDWMRSDWNRRAKEDAHYFVAFGGRQQDEEAFFATGAPVVTVIRAELKRLRGVNPRTRRALEIGCGPGRLIKPLSRLFGEIHGVDVSDEMIALAQQRLLGVPNAHVHATSGASLGLFADEYFDLVYSYAVFQHIPSREVVLQYMQEIGRVLKPGGIFRGQFNGLPPAAQPNTWSGVSFSADQIRGFTKERGLQLLALEGVRTQYMWTTWRKPPRTTIRRITNAASSETVVPNQGGMAAVSVWVTNLPDDADLNTLEVRIDSRSGSLVYIGPAEADGLRQVNAMLPEATRTGLVPVDLWYKGARLCEAAFVRVIPAAPPVPRIVSVTDGINIVEENQSTSGLVKLHLEQLARPEAISVDVDGLPVHFEILCTDPLSLRYELNFRVPEAIPPGQHTIRVHVGERRLLPHEIRIMRPVLAGR